MRRPMIFSYYFSPRLRYLKAHFLELCEAILSTFNVAESGCCCLVIVGLGLWVKFDFGLFLQMGLKVYFSKWVSYLGSKSQRVTLPYGVAKQGSREEKCMLTEPVEPFGANAVWLNGQVDVQVPWERIFSWPLPFEGWGSPERPESIGLARKYHDDPPEDCD